MFLDEKLEKIYSENSDKGKRAKELITACVESLDKTNVTTYFDSLKRVDYSWKLFVRSTKNMTLMVLEIMFLNAQETRLMFVKRLLVGKAMEE